MPSPQPIPAQLTFSFEPALPDRFASLRSYVAHRAAIARKPMKSQAADMDIAPSTLARKLNPAEGDTQRMNSDDLEAWIQSTGEAEAVIEYLAAKYMDSPDARRARLVARMESVLAEMASVLPSLRESA